MSKHRKPRPLDADHYEAGPDHPDPGRTPRRKTLSAPLRGQ